MKAGWITMTLADACEVFTDGDWVESKDQSPDGIRLIQPAMSARASSSPETRKLAIFPKRHSSDCDALKFLGATVSSHACLILSVEAAFCRTPANG